MITPFTHHPEYQHRLNIVSADFFEILGTDRISDTNLIFGEKFSAYRKAWRENPKNNVVGDFPLHLDVESTNTCNLRCTMCQIPFGKMKPGYLDMELYARIIKEIRQHFLPSIKFNFRGEPLMHRDIAKLVQMAKEAGVLEVQFNSNGALLTDSLSKDLIESGLDRIKFSVDAASPEIYNAIRQGTRYDITIPKILRFLEIRNQMGRPLPSVQVQMVYMADNHREAENYVKFWEDKVNRIGFSRYRSGHNRTGEKQRLEALSHRFPCPQLWQRLVILWDGTVLMCCGDHHMKNPVGNVTKTPIAEIWRSELLQKYRKLHLEHKFDEIIACQTCEVNYA